MATNEPLSLADFLQKTLTTLNNLPQEDDDVGTRFLSEGATFRELADFFETNPEIPAQLEILEGKEARILIKKICEDRATLLGLEGSSDPSVQTELSKRFSNQSRLPIEIARWQQAKKPLKKRFFDLHELNKGRVKQFIVELGEQRRAKIYNTANEARAIQQKLTEKPIFGLSLDAIYAEVTGRVVDANPAANTPEAKMVIVDQLKKTGLDTELLAPAREVTQITKTILEHEDVVNTPVVTEAMAQGRAPQLAVDLSRAATIVSSFESAGKTGAPQKLLMDAVHSVFPSLQANSMEHMVARAWNRVTAKVEGTQSLLEKRLEPLIQDITQSREFAEFLQKNNNLSAQQRGGSIGGLFRGVSSSLQVTDGEMLDYLEALYRRNPLGEIRPEEVFAMKAYALVAKTGRQDDFFHFEIGASPLEWILRLGAGRAAGGAVAAGETRVAQGFFGKILTGLGFGGTVAKIGGGPLGLAALAGSAGLSLLGKLVSGEIFNFDAISKFFAVGRANYKESPWPAVITALIVAIPMSLMFLTQGTTNWQIPREAGGGDVTEGSGDMGPIEYTGPAPANTLQCTNYTVTQRQFCDNSGCVTGRPLSEAQATTLNGVFENEAYKQIGLYNCLLGCPANSVNFYSGGASNWWGWAAATRSIVLYDGFFSGGALSQARALAHELAHTYMQLNPDLELAFEQEGYCGRLCTYPSGSLGECSAAETLRETFAESAAMYIVGQDLRSLCPKGYDFIDRMFRSCNP